METMMKNRDLKPSAEKILFVWIFLLFLGSSRFAGAAGTPLIRIDQTIYTFPPVFEGQKLSHTFPVFNRGTGVLHIRKVRPS